MDIAIKLTINSTPWEGSVPAEMTLLQLLRQQLALNGAKEGCGIGECGACTVLLALPNPTSGTLGPARPVNACMILAAEADGATLRTIEGLADPQGLSELQQAFIDHHAVQCGFCTPGMLLSAQSLLERTPHPDDDEIVEAISGNLCRCTGYVAIVDAVRDVAGRVPSEQGPDQANANKARGDA